MCVLTQFYKKLIEISLAEEVKANLFSIDIDIKFI